VLPVRGDRTTDDHGAGRSLGESRPLQRVHFFAHVTEIRLLLAAPAFRNVTRRSTGTAYRRRVVVAAAARRDWRKRGRLSAVHTAATAFTTHGVWNGGQPILLVSHDTDGAWQFLPETALTGDEGLALHLRHVLERHPELNALTDLPPGWAAEREAPGRGWSRYPLPADE
jgi:hypothetical protein